MKKVIIITRDGEYPDVSAAYKKYTQSNSIVINRNIHQYIKNDVFRDLCINEPNSNDVESKKNHESKWDALNKKNIIIEYKKRITRKKDCPSERKKDYYVWQFETFISQEIDNAIQDKNPYVRFECKNKNDKEFDVFFDVYFVFLNRIFDTIVDGPEEYGVLVDDEHRLKFIEAICTDCGISKEAQEKAILYIHDKEWYKSDISYSVLLEGGYINDEGLNDTIKEELVKYFSTIKVFRHIPHPIFNEIKDLDFTEDDEEVKLLKRKFF